MTEVTESNQEQSQSALQPKPQFPPQIQAEIT